MSAFKGVKINNKPIIGLIDIPILNQRWFGGKKLGVKFNNKKCKKNLINKSFNQTISIIR